MVGYDVKDNRNQKDGTLNDVLPVVIKADNRHALVNNTEEGHGADDGMRELDAVSGAGQAREECISRRDEG